MSKVLTQAKNRYQKAIIIESVCLVVFGVFLAIWQGESAVKICESLKIDVLHVDDQEQFAEDWLPQFIHAL